jgi:hypothetical protein
MMNVSHLATWRQLWYSLCVINEVCHGDRDVISGHLRWQLSLVQHNVLATFVRGTKFHRTNTGRYNDSDTVHITSKLCLNKN